MVKENLRNKLRPFTEILKMRREEANRKMAIEMVALAIIQFLWLWSSRKPCVCVCGYGVLLAMSHMKLLQFIAAKFWAEKRKCRTKLALPSKFQAYRGRPLCRRLVLEDCKRRCSIWIG